MSQPAEVRTWSALIPTLPHSFQSGHPTTVYMYPPPHPILHPFKIYLMSLINYCCWSNVDMKGSSLSFFEHDMFRVKVLINPSADNLQLFDLSCHFLWYRSEKERSHLSRERLSLDKTENAFLPGFSPNYLFVWVLWRKPVLGGPKNANVQRPW